MRRRKSSGSGGGIVVLIMLGVLIYVLTAAYQFAAEHVAAIVVLVSIIGAAWLVLRPGRKQTPEPQLSFTVKTETTGIGIQPAYGGVQGRKTPAAKWVEPGQEVQVGNVRIASGLFYLGDTLLLADGRTTNQYVINPALRLSPTQPDVAGTTMPYWPSYASITPSARRGFLQWMAEGRSGADYGIGYVFLFFYGLEHRQFIDKSESAARMVIPEVERLLSIYGGNHSFRSYANNFLVHARIAAGIPFEPPRLTPERTGSSEIDPAVRLYLGEKLVTSDALSAHDALLWVLGQPDTYLRTPAIRCFDEFVALWNIRFAAQFPSGFCISVPRQTIKFTYRAASGAFQVDVAGPHTRYPDVAAARQALGPLQTLVQSCTSELETFSRFIGRHPQQKSSLQAILLLPEPLQDSSKHTVLAAVAENMSAIMGARNTATKKCREILKAAELDFSENAKLPQAVLDRLGQALDRINVAIEPDKRYGGGTAQLDDQVVIFKAEKGGPIDASKPAYQSMKAQVEVAALAAAADGSSTLEELQAIIANIKAAPNLSRIEGLRLIAYAITIFKSPPKQERIMRRLAQLPDRDRQAIAVAAKSVIQKPEQVSPGEVKFFERLHRALGLPQEQVYSDLHRAATASDEPVAVSSESRTTGIPIPREPDPGIHIDAKRLATIRRQTQEVSNLLSQVFTDDIQPSGVEPPPAPPPDRSSFNGLDKSHAELVEYLELKGEITRQEFDERAKSLKLLPEGAIETINEWSFDHLDGPLLEDGEHIVIAAEMRKRLAELRNAET